MTLRFFFSLSDKDTTIFCICGNAINYPTPFIYTCEWSCPYPHQNEICGANPNGNFDGIGGYAFFNVYTQGK